MHGPYCAHGIERPNHRSTGHIKYYYNEPINHLNRLINDTICEPKRHYIRLMTKYNWQQKDWPDFNYSLRGLEDALYAFAEKVGLKVEKTIPSTSQRIYRYNNLTEN